MHGTHPDIVRRLKKAEGHLRAIIGMIEAGRPCMQLAQQMQAVESALSKAKKELIHDHIEHCLQGDTEQGTEAALREIKQLAKYL
ncbi:MAG: metal-sensing transcriptional repressor [Rhodoblastus sp.]